MSSCFALQEPKKGAQNKDATQLMQAEHLLKMSNLIHLRYFQ